MEYRQPEDQFQTALASRDIIGQAKGVIMERFNIDAEEGRLSQSPNTPLAQVARRLVNVEYLR